MADYNFAYTMSMRTSPGDVSNDNVALLLLRGGNDNDSVVQTTKQAHCMVTRQGTVQSQSFAFRSAAVTARMPFHVVVQKRTLGTTKFLAVGWTYP
jgi:hypothetical protein